MNAIFYISAAVAIITTVIVIIQTNAVHALLHLTVSLLAVAVIFFTLGAPFVAALEVIIYAGAIMVLFVFVIMMLNLGSHAVKQEQSWLKPNIWVGPGIFGLILLGEIIYILGHYGGARIGIGEVDPRQVGYSLFTTYLLGVEIASLVLLAGLVGAYHLGRRLGIPAQIEEE
ncbi:MAG: NADH-quinone oxidoreductase subunit J [Armatimonadota bacterium]